jgi:hypothetical protein
VNDVARGQAEAGGQPRLARGAAADRAACGEEFRAGGAMDRAIDAAAAEQGAVRGVDDGVDGKTRDVASFEGDSIQGCHDRFSGCWTIGRMP